MRLEDPRCAMLDAGRTTLALRGLQKPDGCYPFLDRLRGRRRWQQLLRCALSRIRLSARPGQVRIAPMPGTSPAP
jgi:hypothetical protein